jgi:poly(A) polymerase
MTICILTLDIKVMKQFYQILPILSDTGFVQLSQIFAEHNARLYAVGGCIRDSLLSNMVDMSQIDIDLATPIPPVQVIDILDKNTIKYFTMGLEFGTITAHLNGINYEITSFRQDITTNGRHAVVAFSDNMVLDAQRRDFTINALYYDTQGIVYDPLECGTDDLNQQKIQFIGNPHNRITEDYLRILRYFRFLARFGMDSYDNTLFQSHDYREKLGVLSGHRISHELRKIIHYPFAHEVLTQITRLGYHSVLFENLILTISIFEKFQKINAVSDYLLASLLCKSDTQNIKKSVLLSRQDRKKINDFANLYTSLQAYCQAKAWGAILELQYDYDISLWRDLLSFLEMDFPALETKIKAVKQFTLPAFTLKGENLLAQGYTQGKEIASVLKQKRTQFVEQFLADNFSF